MQSGSAKSQTEDVWSHVCTTSIMLVAERQEDIELSRLSWKRDTCHGHLIFLFQKREESGGYAREGGRRTIRTWICDFQRTHRALVSVCYFLREMWSKYSSLIVIFEW